MSLHSPPFPAERVDLAERRGIRDALGRVFQRQQEEAEDRSTVSTERIRQRLLDDIGGFLVEHKLEVSAHNLTVAHDAFSGLNPRLKRRIEKRREDGERITQTWLDEVSGREDDSRNDDIVTQLVASLEANLNDFSASTTDARSATSKYNKHLEEHIDELEKNGDRGVITDIAGFTRAMLERSRRIEAELREREKEAKTLRRNLEKAKHDAEIDYLTGLPNRRAFTTLLDQHYREAKAEMEPLCVAICDIDHFKRVNDTHGHDAGDRVIKAVADLLAGVTNKNCHAARHGGEEFVMLFRGISLARAHEALDEAREELAGRRFVNRKSDQPFGQITFSGGLVDVFRYDSPQTALSAADDALYRAKEGGRNQIRTIS